MPRVRGTPLRIRVLDAQGRFLGGTVDLEIKHQRRGAKTTLRSVDASGEVRLRSSAAQVTLRGLDASGEISVQGLRPAQARNCEITATPSTGPFRGQPQQAVAAVGMETLDFVFTHGEHAAQSEGPNTYLVTGTVYSPDSASVVELQVVIVDKNVGRETTLGGGVTDKRGAYAVRFEIAPQELEQKQQPDLQARVFSGKTFVGASSIRFDATMRETLDVILPARSAAIATEHETLTQALGREFDGRLGDLKETDEQQDISYLANKTGWDARAVALAALADQLSERRVSGENIPAPLYYALLRAGLPANPDALYRVDARTVDRVWGEAMQQGVIPESLAEAVPEARRAFQQLSAETLLKGTTPAGVSRLEEVLELARLSGDQQQQFAALYVEHRDDLPKFWDAVTATLGSDAAQRLQVNAKLGFLTLNNAPLMARLQTVAGRDLTDPIELAGAGFYSASTWSEALGGDVPVPDQIAGATAEEKRANYGEYLAAQVRLSYPTQAVGHMVQTGALEVDVPDEIDAFLTEHRGRFEIGLQPVEQYVQQTGAAIGARAAAQIKRIQRVYQITPSDQAMTALIASGVDSAYRVMQYDRSVFVKTFEQDVGGAKAAMQTYDKSAQVYNAVLNVAISFLTAKDGIPLGFQGPAARDGAAAGRGTRMLDPAPRSPASDVIAYPTLEGLFGSMDFCACEECRSNLSPAAYLVDLLNFIDQPDPPSGTENPQTVLLERRPDIEHLPLSCENTNTALPYIDVVNETLEYFIANDVTAFSLEGYLGHDTGDAESADLLARPQFVMDEAYAALLGQRFPLLLPFHRALEGLRAYFAKFEVPLVRAMETVRAHDELARGGAPYGGIDILIETLGLSRAEYTIFTDSTAVPLWRMYGFANGTTDADVIAELSNAKRFARYLEISYEDLVELLKTRFVNPGGGLIPKLERLGVPIATLVALKNGTITVADFDAALPTGAGAPDPAAYGGDIAAWVTDDANFARIMGLIVLTDPTGDPDPCNFDGLEFRHAEPMADPTDTSTRLGAAEFVRLLRFVRLWKKTQWPIEHVDAAITGLYRANLGPYRAADGDTLAKLDNGFDTLLPRLAVTLQVLAALDLTPAKELLPALACWSAIDTHGERALYRQMFLNPALLALDSVFADDGSGEFLHGNAKIADHAEALRSAFNLTGDEFSLILAALGFGPNRKLDIANVSAIYRHAWLARKLKLSVREMLVLKELSGLDPFTLDDLVRPAILRLIALAETLKESGLKSTGALYLFWNEDLNGRSDPDAAQMTEFARALRGDFAAIDDQFRVTEDPSGDIARARMTLVYGTEAATRFFALLDDTVDLDAPYTNPQPQLNAAIKAIDPKIGYDHFRHLLTYTGVLTAAKRDALKGVAAPPAGFVDAVDALFDRSEDVQRAFFSLYPELKPLYVDYVASPDPPDIKRKRLLAAFRPELSRRRKQQQALQRLSAATGVAPEFAKTIVDAPAEPHPLHAAGRPNRPALQDILSMDESGLGVQFFFRDTATGAVDLEVDAGGALDYGGDATPLPENPGPGNTISGIWYGRIEAPDDGLYNFVIEANAPADVTLILDGQERPLVRTGRTRRNADPIELRAGKLHDIVLTVENVRGSLRFSWETPARGREIVPERFLYSAAVLTPFANVYIRFLKAASIAAALGLTANEMAHFAVHPSYRIAGEGWLNLLAVAGRPDAATAVALLAPLEALVAFARVKAQLSPDDESLLAVLRDPQAAAADSTGALFTLMRWDPTSLNDLVVHFGGQIADLGDWAFFARVHAAFELLTALGVSGSALLAATTNEPDGNTLRALEAALRARYDSDAWRDLVQPINDRLRGLQRHALVAYVLHRLRSRPATDHIDTAEKLFEYFLMDVLMEPCMLTSRIRHALSSVQLFIERCLMNLEPRVSPAALNGKQWEWMKRYRVWEANRKIFLFPENWLEPELRDDKSPFFKEIESQLLQSDITEESAMSALLTYLSKLEEVAQLQVCGLYRIEGDSDKRTGDVDHVIARTPGANRKYYYRRREFGYWTPWEPVKLDIEDNPVVPVVWRDRLLLVWLKLIKEGPATGQKPGGDRALTSLRTGDLPPEPQIKIKAVLAWSEYYDGKWQPVKTSDVDLPTQLTSSASQGGLTSFRKALRLAVAGPVSDDEPSSDDALYVGIQSSGYGATNAAFVLHNTNSAPEQGGLGKFQLPKARMAGMFFNVFITVYQSNPAANGQSYNNQIYRLVLSPNSGLEVVDAHQPLERPFTAPMFAHDARHTFYVSTKEEHVQIWENLDIGVSVGTIATETATIVPIVVEEYPFEIQPRFWGDPAPIGPNPELVNPAPMREFISQDAYIHQGLGTAGVVQYGEQQIGPAGSIGPVGGAGTS